MSNKRKKTLEISQHINEIVRMTTASGYDTEKTQGYTVNIGVYEREDNNDYVRGWWEICSDDQSCYGEGSLTFDLEKKCFDYDGCFDLSHKVCDILSKHGYDMTEVDSRLF